MKVKWFVLFLVALMLWSLPLCIAYASTIPNVSQEMFSANFWTGKLSNPDELIMTQEQIVNFNKSIRSLVPNVVYDLNTYPSSLTGSALNDLITKRTIPGEDRYIGVVKVDSAYYENLNKQLNLPAIKEENEINYAFTVRRTNIRTFPTNDVSLSEPNDLEFDMFQETAVGPAEPLLVLHKSLDAKWYLIQTYNYFGWMPVADIAIAKSKENWLEYVNASKFLVVTGSKLTLGNTPYSPEISELELGMGTKLPLVEDAFAPSVVDNQSTAGNYVVKLPVRDINGELKIKLALMPINSDVSEGYLPYTRADIIRQAFKSLGERYGWGGMFNARDCSAYIKDIYSCFGIMLPRNTDEQEISAGKTVKLDSLNTVERDSLLDTLLPGAMLFKKYHVMLYLGKYDGHYYIIHDISSYGDINKKNPDGTLGRIPLNEITVTDLSLPLRSGKQLIEVLTTAKQLENF